MAVKKAADTKIAAAETVKEEKVKKTAAKKPAVKKEASKEEAVQVKEEAPKKYQVSEDHYVYCHLYDDKIKKGAQPG